MLRTQIFEVGPDQTENVLFKSEPNIVKKKNNENEHLHCTIFCLSNSGFSIIIYPLVVLSAKFGHTTVSLYFFLLQLLPKYPFINCTYQPPVYCQRDDKILILMPRILVFKLIMYIFRVVHVQRRKLIRPINNIL